MNKYSVRSFAEEGRVSQRTARRFLNAHLEAGRARAAKKPFRIPLEVEAIMSKRTVTT